MSGNESVFFFQAEDGIRDYKVTGVQTCALPILFSTAFISRFGSFRFGRILWQATQASAPPFMYTCLPRSRVAASAKGRRSEERRVGKEGRSRWSPDH